MSVTVPSPPPRPSKSRLRSLDRNSISSSNSSTPSTDATKLRLNSPISSYNDFPLPERSKYRSRFTEHFDRKTPSSSPSSPIEPPQVQQQQQQQKQLLQQDEIEEKDEDEEYFPPQDEDHNVKKYNIGNLKGSQSLTSLSTESNFLRHSTSIKKRTSATESFTQQNIKNHEEQQHPQKPVKKERPITQLKASKSTPTQSSKGRKHSSGSIKLAYNKLPSIGNRNRATTVIQRYENWLIFLKCISNWLDETSKISMTSSRAFSSRATPHLKPKEGILTIRSGLKVLTQHVSERQAMFSKQLDKHVNIVNELRKICKEKIHKLKSDPQLVMDELLRRAEVTRGKMNHLNRCCKQADKSKGQQLEMDPWLANLYVLRQLKKEVDEENRLRLLMVTVQQETRTYEEKLISLVKTAVEYSYKQLAPEIWDGSNDPETAPFQQILDQVMPDHEWNTFFDKNADDLVNEEKPIKDYLKINYPNKLHPAVLTLRKGKMERKFKVGGAVRKQFVQRYFILSQGGYLHQFRLDDKVSPERTLFVPGSTVHPSVDIHAAGHLIESFYGQPPTKEGYTFDMLKAGSNHSLLQHSRDKMSTFRTETREDLVAWCKLITMVANGLDPSVVYEISSFPSFSSSTMLDDHSSSSVRRPSRSSQPSIPEHPEIPASPTRSVHLSSKRTTESFNEPSFMRRGLKEDREDDTLGQRELIQNEGMGSKEHENKMMVEDGGERVHEKMPIISTNDNMEADTRKEEAEEKWEEVNGITNVTPPITPPETTLLHETIIEEDEPATDAESFVTASRQESDNESINSIATERGPAKSPSLVSTNYDDAISHISTSNDDSRSISSYYTDAQSSVYFSSNSANNSNRSSVASMPDLPWDLTTEGIQTYQPNLNI